MKYWTFFIKNVIAIERHEFIVAYRKDHRDSILISNDKIDLNRSIKNLFSIDRFRIIRQYLMNIRSMFGPWIMLNRKLSMVVSWFRIILDKFSKIISTRKGSSSIFTVSFRHFSCFHLMKLFFSNRFSPRKSEHVFDKLVFEWDRSWKNQIFTRTNSFSTRNFIQQSTIRSTNSSMFYVWQWYRRCEFILYASWIEICSHCQQRIRWNIVYFQYFSWTNKSQGKIELDESHIVLVFFFCSDWIHSRCFSFLVFDEIICFRWFYSFLRSW